MKLSLTIWLLILYINCHSQNSNWNKTKLKEYFELKCVPNKIKFQGKDTLILSVYPALTMSNRGDEAIALKQNPRRFEYLLQNHSSFKEIYNELYPDTIKINDLYVDTLSQNKLFIAYLDKTLAPFTKAKFKPTLKYSKDELMMVASRFFYCDKVMPDTSIYWHICIGLNGIEEAKWKKDYTLLEAFCFEAIFTYLKDPSKAAFMNNFISYTQELKTEFVNKNNSTEGLLEYVKLKTFDKMAADKILIDRLSDYYETNKATLSFNID